MTEGSRWVLYGTATLVGARLVLAATLLLVGGLQLADTRFMIQLPQRRPRHGQRLVDRLAQCRAP